MRATKTTRTTTTRATTTSTTIYVCLVSLWLRLMLVECSSEQYSPVGVGVILDLDSQVGFTAKSYMDMSLSDFYRANPNYTTRLVLHPKNTKGAIAAASAALELISNEEVQALIGPQNSDEATFVVEVGVKAHVPIISFSTTSSSILPFRSSYVIRSAAVDFSQLQAITAIVERFKWKEIVFLYERTEFGIGFIPYLTDAFQRAGLRLPFMSGIHPSADDNEISEEVKKLMAMQTTVFLVHMTPSLASRLFFLAKNLGMMSEGFAWISTYDSTNSISSIDATTIESMEGILGIRPFVPKSNDLDIFKTRWKAKLLSLQPNTVKSELNIPGLWAYDTIWALALAMERIGPTNATYEKKNNTEGNDLKDIQVSEMGARILGEILKTRFNGLSGEFRLVKGQLQTSAFEIFNVIGNGEKIIGYWTQDGGITGEFGSIKQLRKIIWPGDSLVTPKGWAIPSFGKKLRVGIPVKDGFTEFVKVTKNNETNEISASGFCIDVFKEVIKRLPFKVDNPEFVPLMNETGGSNGTYDDLLGWIPNKTVDIVVGDITIVSYRATKVDFTLPYTESGVVMVVPLKRDTFKDMWIFLKPLHWDLWLTIVMSCIFIGFVVRILEHHVNPQQQLAIGMLFWFPLSLLAFPERKIVANKWSRFVLVIWLFMSYILMQSYTASLSSILTVDQLKPETNDPSCIGYQNGSFVGAFLEKQLNYNKSKLKIYSTIEEYDKALSKGCKHGGVDGIFDEIPYIKVFLHKYPSKYTIVGSTQKTDGFGFAFPLDSPLVPYFSRVILNVTEDVSTMRWIEGNNFGHGYSSEGYEIQISSDNRSLRAYSFAGLFIITTFATILALVCSEQCLGPRFVAMARSFIQNSISGSPSVHPTAESATEMHVMEDPTTVASTEETPSGIPNQSNVEEEAEAENDNQENPSQIPNNGEARSSSRELPMVVASFVS